MTKDKKTYYYLEDIDYLATSDESIWGSGDKETLQRLEKEHLAGKWLNLAAGDGRYNEILLRKANKVVATDFDMGALEKLQLQTPTELQGKLKIKRVDLNERLPFDDGEFDGVFNTGTIHLFPETMVEDILVEIDRVTKIGGRLFLDFACEIKRVTKEGSEMPDERKYYLLDEVRYLIESTLPNYLLDFEQAEVAPEWVGEQENPHFFSCKFWIVSGVKKEYRRI